jgi:mono/diheme cytochrome c family protein
MTPWTRLFVGLLVAGGTMAVCAASPGGGPQGARPEPANGASIYLTHCASCHGTSGRGDGAVAPYLRIPAADLTRIAARNRGVFPGERVRRIIDGRQRVRTHGDSDMPVWGPIFGRSSIRPDEAIVDATLGDLVAHLESLQERPAE